MNVEDLRNYGKGFVEIMTDPEISKQMTKALTAELQRHLGRVNLIRLMWNLPKQTKRMKALNWSRIYEHGLVDQKFFQEVVRSITAIKTLSDIVGKEKASEIYLEIMDKVAYDLMSSMFPSVKDLENCGDVFESFRKYAKAFVNANNRDGVHEIEEVQDTNEVLAYNVKYCIWHEVAKNINEPVLCYPSNCCFDEVFFPRMGAQAGFRFKRSGTLASGASVCDYRFERLR
jgi:hypothetical protein